MADRFDQYRRNAEEAQKWADRASSDDDKAKWLKLVQGWLSLIRVRPRQTDEEQFDNRVAQQDTGQVRSDSSH